MRVEQPGRSGDTCPVLGGSEIENVGQRSPCARAEHRRLAHPAGTGTGVDTETRHVQGLRRTGHENARRDKDNKRGNGDRRPLKSFYSTSSSWRRLGSTSGNGCALTSAGTSGAVKTHRLKERNRQTMPSARPTPLAAMLSASADV